MHLNFHHWFKKSKWTKPAEQAWNPEPVAEKIFTVLQSSPQGLSEPEAARRLLLYGRNEAQKAPKRAVLYELLLEFTSPLLILLLIIGTFSLFFGDKFSAIIVYVMAAMSGLMSFVQEHRAQKAVEKLNSLVQVTAQVFRGGKLSVRRAREIVPGDVVSLSAGNVIPADLFILEAKDLFVSESSLTGESMPAEKFGQESAGAEGKSRLAFMGSSVISGTGRGIVVKTGGYTEFGRLSASLVKNQEMTSFDRGIKDFTWLMIKVILAMVLTVLVINLFTKHDFFSSLLFALAVAIGLAPETLPMIVTINLSKGALDMSKKKVVVKHLDAIQNFGAMDILCTDKTGTLTRDEVVLEKYCDAAGKEDAAVLEYGFLNSFYQTGMKNLLDLAVLKHGHPHLTGYKKVDEIPFDFTRRIMTVIVRRENVQLLVAKGAPEEIFRRCKFFLDGGHKRAFNAPAVKAARAQYDGLSGQGFRVLAVAVRETDFGQKVFSPADENGLALAGFMAFLDPPKDTAKQALAALERAGIKIKILTGDNELVTKKICVDIGLDTGSIVTGDFLSTLSPEKFTQVAENGNIFTRLLPLQKQQIIRALKAGGHTVGFLGDGINDAPALRTADVGISVNNAADVAREAAGIILLKKSLTVLADGVGEGRRVFGNIIKYIRMSASSNFGNILSMVGASLILPFLPMAPTQILLNNFLYDVSQIGIPTDRVDAEYLQKPRPWNIRLIKKFMVIVGPVSSLFDYLTYGVMWFVFKASVNPSLFQTGWFLESLMSQTLVVYVIRTSKIPFLQSRPSKALVATTLVVLSVGIYIPYSSLSKFFGFSQLPPVYFLLLILMMAVYLAATQVVKNWFIRRYEDRQ